MPPLRRMAVLLDLDGTLIDSVPLILASVRHAFEGRRRRPTDAEWIAGIGTPLRVQLEAWTDGPEDLAAVLGRYRTFQNARHDEMTRAFPGAVATLEELHASGHRIAVVTGKLAETAAVSLAHVGMGELVEVVVGANSCAHHKPHPEPVLTALDRLGVGPTDAVFVGDSPLDVEAGNAAGVATAAALWGASTREVLLSAAPTYVLETVTGIAPLLRRIST